jgi:hypothetical protein
MKSQDGGQRGNTVLPVGTRPPHGAKFWSHQDVVIFQNCTKLTTNINKRNLVYLLVTETISTIYLILLFI